MVKREGADGKVKSPVVERQIAKITVLEVGFGNMLASSGEHLCSGVDAHDRMAAIDKPAGVATGATRRVQRPAKRSRVQQLPDDWLLDGYQRIVGRVVGGRPSRVAIEHAKLGNVDTEREGLGLRDDLARLFDSMLCCLVVAGEQAAQ